MSSQEPLSPSEVERQLDEVERLTDFASSGDEYLEALVQNTRLIVQVLQEESIGITGVNRAPPESTTGVITKGAAKGKRAEFLFKRAGENVVASINAARPVEAGDVAKFDANQGGVIPVGEINQTDLDIGASGDQFTFTRSNKDIEEERFNEEFPVTDNVQTATVAVSNASGPYHVEIAFQDDNNQDVVLRNDTNSTEYSGDSNSDVFVDVELSSPQVAVRVIDDSGSANEVDIAGRIS